MKREFDERTPYALAVLVLLGGFMVGLVTVVAVKEAVCVKNSDHSAEAIRACRGER